MGKFVIREVSSGLKFDLHAANGQSILTSEVYTTLHAAGRAWKVSAGMPLWQNWRI